ncbi:MAG: tyrosine-type recombinase/integrase [Roseiflexaceae bacterium]|nr:tyrosine-type recombinase/integrase [Roseiflexaceae bacterium]
MPKRSVGQALTADAMAEQALRPASALVGFDHAIVAGTVSTRSVQKYAQHFLAYCAFARTRDAALEPATLARWRTALVQQQAPVLSPNTINNKLAAVRSIMVAAAEQGYIAGALADAFRRVRGVSVKAMKERRASHRRTRLSPATMRALCDAPDATTPRGVRDRALLHTLASSGMRASATAGLQFDQIVETDQGFGIWVQDKNDLEQRLVLLSREARRWMEEWRRCRHVASQAVFTAYDGRGDARLTAHAMTATAIWQAVQHYAKQVGLDHVKPHDFRRFLGTRLAKQDIRLAQKALGHKDIRTTALHYELDDLALGQSEDLY